MLLFYHVMKQICYKNQYLQYKKKKFQIGVSQYISIDNNHDIKKQEYCVNITCMMYT